MTSFFNVNIHGFYENYYNINFVKDIEDKKKLISLS